MNWFTGKALGTVTAEMDHCEHLTEGAKYYRMTQENDSFGIVGQYATCEACTQAMEKAAAEEVVVCGDCKQPKPRSQTRQWRWYDFYAAQGDVPYCVCHECWKSPGHQRRMAKDEADRRWEMGEDDDRDDSYDNY